MVWSLKLSNDALNQNKKFLNNFVGPFIITHKANHKVFKVAKFPHSTLFLVNIDRIKHFKFTHLFDKNCAGPDIGENNKQPNKNNDTENEKSDSNEPNNDDKPKAKTSRKPKNKCKQGVDNDPNYIPRTSARLREKVNKNNNNNTHNTLDTPVLTQPVWKNPIPPNNPIKNPIINPIRNPRINNSTNGNQPATAQAMPKTRQ